MTQALTAAVVVIVLAQLVFIAAVLMLGYRVVRVFKRGRRPPMGSLDYRIYSRIKRLGVLLVGRSGIGRLISHELAPGIHGLVADVSGRGQIGLILQHMGTRPALRPEQRLVLDIGANDGFQGSHSFNLIQLGWSAALFEPNPYVFQELVRNVKASHPDRGVDRVVTRNVAVTPDSDGQARLFVRGFRHTGSSLVREGGAKESIEVTTESVATALRGVEEEFRSRGVAASLPKDPGVLSIDIEGLDFDVLAACFAWGLRPCYILVEAREDTEPFDQLVLPLGYERLAYLGADLIYAKSIGAGPDTAESTTG